MMMEAQKTAPSSASSANGSRRRNTRTAGTDAVQLGCAEDHVCAAAGSTDDPYAAYKAALARLEEKLGSAWPKLADETVCLTVVDQAEARLSVITAALSAYCSALLLRGVNPAESPVIEHLEKTKELLGRLTQLKKGADSVVGEKAVE